MATQGPLFPGTTGTLANAGTSENANDWLTAANIVSDNGSEAQITAATYDSPDISYLLIASNFGFTTSGTINGITVEIDRRSIILNSGKDFRVQLATGTTFADLVGSNKAAPATIWPTTSTVATYGGAADTWTAGLTSTQVNDPGFAVFLSCQANIANADVGVDYIRVTVTYTASTNETVTPGVASLTTATFVPTVTATANQTATPGVATLTIAAFDPTVTATDNQSVTPGAASLTLTAFEPTVSASSGTMATPGVASLALTAFAPTASVTDHQTVTPAVAALSTSTFAPTVTASDHQNVVPPPATLTLATFIPTVTAIDPQLVTPGVASLTTTGFAPTVNAGQSATPDPESLILTTFAPTVALTDNQLVTPDVAALTLQAFAATILAPVTVTPDLGELALTGYAPTVLAQTPGALILTPVTASLVLTRYTPLPVVAFRGIGGSIQSSAALHASLLRSAEIVAVLAAGDPAIEGTIDD